MIFVRSDALAAEGGTCSATDLQPPFELTTGALPEHQWWRANLSKALMRNAAHHRRQEEARPMAVALHTWMLAPGEWAWQDSPERLRAERDMDRYAHTLTKGSKRRLDVMDEDPAA